MRYRLKLLTVSARKQILNLQFDYLIGQLLGASGKTLHPRNVGFAGFHEISFQIICENNSWIWLFRVNLLSVAGWSNLWTSGIISMRRFGVVNLRRSGVINLRRSGVMNLRRSKILNLRSSGIRNLRNHVSRPDPRNSGVMGEGFGNVRKAKSKT
jgi:hypothetical protein